MLLLVVAPAVVPPAYEETIPTPETPVLAFVDFVVEVVKKLESVENVDCLEFADWLLL